MVDDNQCFSEHTNSSSTNLVYFIDNTFWHPFLTSHYTKMTIERIPNKFPLELQEDTLTRPLSSKIGDEKVFKLLENDLKLSGTLIQKLEPAGNESK